MKKTIIAFLSVSLLLSGCGQHEPKEKDVNKDKKISVKHQKQEHKKTSLQNPNTLYKDEFYPKVTALIKSSSTYWDKNWYSTFNPIKSNQVDGNSSINKIIEIKQQMSSYSDKVYNIKSPSYFNTEQKEYLEAFKKNFSFSLQKKMMGPAMLERNIKNNELDDDKLILINEKISESNKYYSDAMKSLDLLNKSFK